MSTFGGKNLNIDGLLKMNHDFYFFVDRMTREIKENYFIKKYAKGQMISKKSTDIEYFGIIVKGRVRVINEFENGNIYLIEINNSIDYIGEVVILSREKKASVSIEAISDCYIFFIERDRAERWIKSDIEILYKISSRVAQKLYSSSIEKGRKLYYSSDWILAKYLINECENLDIEKKPYVLVNKTRDTISEEVGMNIKTLNRNIYKLKDKGLLGINKGKIYMDYEKYKKAKSYLLI